MYDAAAPFVCEDEVDWDGAVWCVALAEGEGKGKIENGFIESGRVDENAVAL